MIQSQTSFGPRGGGGNVAAQSMMSVRRNAAIGDALCATVVADRLIDLGYNVSFQTHDMIHCVLRLHPRLAEVVTPGGFCDVNLDNAYESDPQRRQKHFHLMFFEAAHRQLSRQGIVLGPPTNCRPRLIVPEMDKERWRVRFSQYPKPWVTVCPRSDTYNVRQVPDGIWAEIARNTIGTKFWIGRHPAPANFVDLHAQHFDDVMRWIAISDILLTVDTGPMHIAAAVGVPIVAISQSSSPELHLNDQNDFIALRPKLDCLNCQQNICPISPYAPPCQQIDPALVAEWANAKLRSQESDTVAAVIPIFKPPVDRLNRCLEAILPQVDEVVVTRDAGGVVPSGALQNAKIRYVASGQREMGYGRNVNFGARHTTSKWLWLLNDDCFMAPDAIQHVRKCMLPSVGIIGHMLRYPDGRIQHGGKFRNPGMRGWGHIDQGKMDPSIREPIEVENVTGASIVVRRKAFYEIGGNDEDFHFYSVDDAMCLSLRSRGYKVVFCPQASAIHEEAATSRGDSRIAEWVRQGNAAFDRKWGWWITQNLNTIPGKF